MSDPVGVAIIGTGFGAENHAEQFARIGVCATTAVEPRQPLGGTS